jgi:hypothetical protein
MAPEQVIQHYRKGGCPSGGGGAPESGFLMFLNLLTSIDRVLDFPIIFLEADVLQLPNFF